MTIRQIQHLLAYLGYYPLAVDGIWGPTSEAACLVFQEDFGGIGVDGIPGVETQKALRHAVSFGLPEREDKPAEKPMDEDALFWAGIRNFSKVEFECHCGCGLNNVDHRLVLLCQKVRDHFGAAFNISSPCRCKKNNDRLPNAAKNSRHLYGRAVDFGITGHSDWEVKKYLDTLPEVAYSYIMQGGNVHMDIV